MSGLKDYQKINHFPATAEISRKDSLARNLVGGGGRWAGVAR